jgi:uncharacterized protein YndB with AHSA1/START domain
MEQQPVLNRSAEQAVIHSTFVIERSFPKSPEVVFAAFSDPAKKRRWFAEGENHDLESFEMDFRDGGTERFQYRFKAGSPLEGMVLTSEGRFQDILPNQRLLSSSTMDIGGRRVSVALVTIELLPTQNGTDLICTHQGAFFEGSGGPQMREMGWRSLFEKLAKELSR